MEWLAANWGWVMGVGGIGGVATALRKFVPALVAFLGDAGTAPFLRAQNKALRQLLEERSNDYDELLKDYAELAKLRRTQGTPPAIPDEGRELP